MKAYLKFDLDDPYEKISLENCLKADKMKIVIDELYNDVFRHEIKHNGNQVYSEIWNKVNEYFKESLE